MQFYDSEWGSLKGQYIVVVRDNEHAQLLMKTEYQLMNSFIKNHIPVVYQEDVNKILQPIQLILDYFNQAPINEYQVISYQSLIHRSVVLKSIIKKKSRTLRKGSFDLIKTQLQEERFLTIMNIDRKKDLKQNEEFHTFGDFTSNIDTIIETGFTHEYWFAVLIVTYEKLGFTHIDLLKQTIRVFIKKKEQRSKILYLIGLWLNYRFVDLVNDNSVFCTMFLQFLQLAELINGEQQQDLYNRINCILNGKMNVLTSSLNAPSPTSLSRKQSFHRPKRQKNFRNLSVGVLPQEIIYSNQVAFNGNQFYLNTNVEQLQKQLWIIDVEMFSKLSTTTLLDSKSLIKNQEISDYFDYLLFHMIFSTILCSKEQRGQMINKIIELNLLAKEAKHNQLMHLIYCYFTHSIIQQIMNKIYPLSPIYQQKLEELISSEHFKTIIPIDVNDRQGIIPCLSQIQLHVYRFQDIYDKQYHLIESKWALLAQQVFQICHMQVLIRSLNGTYLMHKDELICKYLKSGIKSQLQSYFNCNKQSLEIQMFKIYNQI